MEPEFNELYVPDEDKKYSHLFTVVSEDNAWHYQGCNEHLGWFVAESRKVGDKLVYFQFVTDPLFCPWCYAIHRGTDMNMVIGNQVNVDTFKSNA